MDSRPQRTIWVIVAAGGILQGLAALLVRTGTIGHRPGVALQISIVWILIVVLALLATRRLERLASRIVEHQQAHRLTLSQMEQLEAQNAVLQVITRTPDVALAFQALARRLARIVPCDRVGLALLKEGGQEFQTYTARVAEEERRHRPRPELEFSMDRSIVGQAVRERAPVVVDVLADAAPDFFDANVLHSAGFKSALIVPLISKGRAVGTINLISRQPTAFRIEDAKALQSIAEILAVAFVAQQAQVALARFRTVEAMSEMTLSIANDINSALQIIIGHCDLIERGYAHDPALQRDLATVIRQAQRIATLLENMRSAAADRLREVAASVNEAGVPSSPESLVEEDPT
jgi:transcriptional regulator with GAF, ATPase, and Fis domain